MYNFELLPSRRNFWNTNSLLEKEFERLFDTFSQETSVLAIPCEILDGEKHYTIGMDIPGMNQEDIELEVKDNQLYITGERKAVNDEKNSVLRSERRYGKFSRVFTLPQNVKSEAIEAHFANGVLNVVIPKEEKAQARKITINGGQNARTVETTLKS